MVLINGIESNHIDVMDRGLAYGDGLFSTMKVQYGEVQLWGYHLQRLQLGTQKLHFPAINWSQLTQEISDVAKSVVEIKESVIKVMVTRGSGGRGYSAEGCESPLRIISTSVYPEFYHQWQQQGIKLIQCESQLSSNKQLAGLKTLNRLDQVLIKQELQKKQAIEGIVCDNQGYIIEACTANVFIYLDNEWKTPKLDNSGVAGVMRRQVMALALEAGINIIEEQIHIDRMTEVKAICLTNALMGIVPVNQYQHILFTEQNLEYCKQLQSLMSKGMKK